MRFPRTGSASSKRRKKTSPLDFLFGGGGRFFEQVLGVFFFGLLDVFCFFS